MDLLTICIGIAVAIATVATMYFSTEFDRRKSRDDDNGGGIKV